VVVVGHRTITYLHTASERAIPLPAGSAAMITHGVIDGGRWLLGDEDGGLHLLLLRTSSGSGSGSDGHVDMQLQRLGEVRRPVTKCLGVRERERQQERRTE
jgi:hypothetical protein